MKKQRASGILLHPTSLPSPYGIGDFGPSAYQFVDFLVSSGQKLWQTLPLGPTSAGDSPYQCFSTFAGNTLFISPEILYEKGLLSQTDFDEKPPFSDTKVEYGKVKLYKDSLFQKAYRNFLQKDNCESFYQFCNANASWLDDFALFSALKQYFITQRKNTPLLDVQQMYPLDSLLTENQWIDYFYGAVWSTWPKAIASHQQYALKGYEKLLAKDIQYHKFLQYEFFYEWHKLKKYANDKHIQIIGDLPIFISYDSADVWANPTLFSLDSNGYPTSVAGVPPDYFSATGQLWGNPLYLWKNHEKDGYCWWIQRICKALEISDILRIDHFRGFESYWEIPFGDPDATRGTWKKGPGKKLFTAIKNHLGELPLIAEDLGIITDAVRSLRDDLGLPGMKVLQFAFDDSENNDYLPHNFDKNSVVYTGTHDNNTSLGWYENASEAERDYVRRYMNVDGSCISRDLIRLAVSSTAQFAIFPLQDVMSLPSSARMNLPGTASGNWQWRFHPEMLTEEIARYLSYINRIFKR